MTTAPATSCVPLRLLADGQVRPRLRTRLVRDPRRIPKKLATSIRGCCAGGNSWPLYAYGPPGVGKTYAGLFLCDRCADPCDFFEFQSLCGECMRAKSGTLSLRSGQSFIYPDATEYWRNMQRANLIVVDDVGVRIPTEHQYETFKALLDCRERLPLMLISNVAPVELLTVFDDRIISRLSAGTIVKVEGEDQRDWRKR